MKENNIQKSLGIIVSSVVHLLFFSTLFLIKINWQVQLPEFIEIQFESSAKQATMIPPETNAPPINQDPEKMSLPLRRTDIPEEEILNINEKSKVMSEDDVELLEVNKIDEKMDYENPSHANLETKQVAEIETDAKLSPDLISDIGAIQDELPFKIEGKAAQRTILLKTIPQYPSGLQQEAIVKIRFTVLPNGLIGEMIPIIKSNDVLEKITLDALKQWRFNPLSANVAQIPEQGTITFRYLLR